LVTPVATPIGLGQGVEMMSSSDSKSSQFQAQLAFWKGMTDESKSSRLPPVKRQKKRRRSEQFNQTMSFWSSLESPPKMVLEEKEPNPKINVLETKFDSTLNLFEQSKTTSEIDKRKARKINRERERRKQIGVCFQQLASELRLNRSSKMDKTLILTESRYTIQKLRQRNNELLKEREDMRKRIEKLTSCLQAMCSKPVPLKPQQQHVQQLTTHQLRTYPSASRRVENQGSLPASTLCVPNNPSSPIDQDSAPCQDLYSFQAHSNSNPPPKLNSALISEDDKSDSRDSISSR